MTQQQVSPASVVRTTQIIIGALISGLVCFGGIALTSQNQPGGQSVLTMVGAGLSLMQVLMWIVIPGIVAKAQLKDLRDVAEADRMPLLAQAFLTRKIIGAALLEGAGFFNLVGYMIERQVISLAIVGVLLALLAAMLPTQGQFDSWAEEMQREFSGM